MIEFGAHIHELNLQKVRIENYLKLDRTRSNSRSMVKKLKAIRKLWARNKEIMDQVISNIQLEDGM